MEGALNAEWADSEDWVERAEAETLETLEWLEWLDRVEAGS